MLKKPVYQSNIHNEILGLITTRISPTRYTPTNGITPRYIRPILSPVVDWATKILSPNGGVNIPILRFTVMMMPKCIGSIPKDSARGKSMGVKINIAEAGSIKHPRNSRRRFTDNIYDHFSTPISAIQATNCWGTPCTVRSHENAAAVATIMRICAVIRVDSAAQSTISNQVIER